MAPTNGYISVDALKATLRDTRTVDDDAYERAIEAASRRIDAWTGRQFWRTDLAEARLFRASTRFLVRTGDFADTTGMTVEVADSGGVFAALAGAAWQAEPHVRVNGHPYTAIVSTTGLVGFPVSGRLPRVRVTARWGWAGIPTPVAQACQLLATAYVKARDLTAGVTGFEQDSARVDALTPQVEALLAEYRNPTAVGEPQPRAEATT